MAQWQEDGTLLGFTLSEQAARKTADTVRKVQAMPANVVGNTLGRRPGGTNSTLHWITFANNYAGVIPAYGVIKLGGGGMGSIGGDQGGTPGTLGPVYSADRPDGTLGANYAINGSRDVPEGGFGQALTYGEVQALYDSTTGTPNDGQGWGPITDSFKLGLGQPACCIVPGGAYDTDGTTLVFDFQPIKSCLSKLHSGTLAVGSSASFDVWVGAGGSEAVSSPLMSVTAFNQSGSTITDTTKLYEIKQINGVWYVTSAGGKARFISGTLNGSLASGTVNHYWDGSSPGSTVTLVDTESVFTYSSNVAFQATYDPVADKYNLTWIKC